MTTPEQIHYIIIDDDSTVARKIAQALAEAGLSWILAAQYFDLESAKEATKDNGLADVQVAFVDGNMSRFNSGGKDGRIMNMALAENAPHIIKVGNSASYQQPVGSDIFINKSYSQHEVLQEIDTLAQQQLR